MRVAEAMPISEGAFTDLENILRQAVTFVTEITMLRVQGKTQS